MSRQISGYLSSSSSLKGQRWAFGEKLEQSKSYLVVAKETIKSKFTVVDFMSSSAFGDEWMIKSPDLAKNEEQKEEGDQLYRLYSV